MRSSNRLVKSTPDYAEIAFKHTDLQEFPFYVDLHYILKRGDSGFYCFVTYQASFEEPRHLGQTRLVLRLNPTIFNYAIVSDARQATLPTPQERAAGEVLNPSEAVRLADGSIDHKYLWSEYEGGHHVHGLCGDNIGVWMISASNEYLNGGPTKQNLTLHQTTTTPVLLKMLESGHYGAGALNFNSGEVWEKFFGPFFIYVNSGHNAAEMWTDAKRKAEAEINKWPYDWVAHRLYPLERGIITRVVDISDGSSPEGCWVGLAQPVTGDTPNWQQQGKGYQFWVQADSNGRFIIPNVRSGNYTLYAFVEGVLGEFRLDGVNVVANQTTDIGRLYLNPWL